MRALIACEFSGAVRDAIQKVAPAGSYILSADLRPAETPGSHHQGDVLDLLHDSWDLLIAHPPCTYLANSGVRWLHEDPTRLSLMKQGAEFFKLLYSAPVPHIAVENPIMHHYGRYFTGAGKPTQIIQPWQFGHGETKATGLWLKNLPPLEPTNIVPGREQRILLMPPSEDRQKERSKTYPGIAAAMATQWVPYILARI